MAPKSLDQAMAFVDGLELPPGPRTRRGRSPKATPGTIENGGKEAMVVGADILSFVAGTDPRLRTTIMNCLLLAQLAANHQVPSRADIAKWYEAYFDILEKLGWVAQDRGFSEHREARDDFEAHRAILSVATALLGPAPAALALVQSTLASMRAMSKGPWMAIFQRESQAARAARFQVSVAEPAGRGGVVVSLMAFELDATTTLTQVLFFKFRSADVKLRHSSGRLTLDGKLLAGLAPTIADKVAPFVQGYVKKIPI